MKETCDHSKLRCLNQIMNKVIIYRNVFHPSVEHKIRTQVGGTNVVTIDHRSRRNQDKKIRENEFGPLNLNNITNDTIFNINETMKKRERLISTKHDAQCASTIEIPK